MHGVAVAAGCHTRDGQHPPMDAVHEMPACTEVDTVAGRFVHTGITLVAVRTFSFRPKRSRQW